MLKRTVIFLCLTLFLASCGGADGPDIIKTKSGLYGSSEGKFLIEFPGKPISGVIKNVLAGQEFNLYSLSYNQGVEHRYRVSYLDYPEEVLNAWKLDDFFDQIVKGGLVATQDLYVAKREVDTNAYEKSISYKIRSRSVPDALGIIRVLQHEGRTYFIYFVAISNVPSTTDFYDFVNSFRIYKPKV